MEVDQANYTFRSLYAKIDDYKMYQKSPYLAPIIDRWLREDKKIRYRVNGYDLRKIRSYPMDVNLRAIKHHHQTEKDFIYLWTDPNYEKALIFKLGKIKSEKALVQQAVRNIPKIKVVAIFPGTREFEQAILEHPMIRIFRIRNNSSDRRSEVLEDLTVGEILSVVAELLGSHEVFDFIEDQ